MCRKPVYLTKEYQQAAVVSGINSMAIHITSSVIELEVRHPLQKNKKNTKNKNKK